MKINVKEARKQLSALLDQVEGGREVILMRHGKEVAKILPLKKAQNRLPSLREFRASLRAKGKPLSREVIRQREQERF